MLTQYLVGLCCLRRDPEAVEIMLGDMVLDTAIGKERDVDVTVTIHDVDGTTRAFKAFEVKREGQPLDVQPVEQLCLKLLDMDSVSYRAIVSASGFSDAAKKKAARHGVELFEMRPWTGNIEDDFPNWQMSGPVERVIRVALTTLLWREYDLNVGAASGPDVFEVQPAQRVLNGRGRQHPLFANFDEYQREILLRSTEVLSTLGPIRAKLVSLANSTDDEIAAMNPCWSHSHTFDIHRDDVHVEIGNDSVRLDTITIIGTLEWKNYLDVGEYYIMRRVSDGEVFAGAAITLLTRPGHMSCFVLSTESEVAGIHTVRLNRKQQNAIRKLKLDVPASRQPDSIGSDSAT